MSEFVLPFPKYVLMTCTGTDEYNVLVLTDEIHNDEHKLNND